MGGRYLGYTDLKGASSGMVTDIRTLEVGDVVFLTMWDRAEELDSYDVEDAFVFAAKVTSKERVGFESHTYGDKTQTRESWRIDFDEADEYIYVTIENNEFRERIPAVFREADSAAAHIKDSYASSLKYLTEEYEEARKKMEYRKATIEKPVEVKLEYKGER